MPTIHVQSLTKSFGPLTAVGGISFTVESGAIVGLLGGNGAGKTTTISMLLGLLLPTSGTVTVLGHDMARHRSCALPLMNFSSPYVDLPGRLTVKQILTVYGDLYGIPNQKTRIAELTESLDLGDFLNRPYGRLSAGQKTRASLAKSLINRPRLLLLDEPTASLDPDTADWVRGYLMDYQAKENATFLLASHNMLEVERMCSTAIIMRKGQIVTQGAPRALIETYGRTTLEEVFLDIARSHG
jgi:ABC-2 type transport system ATP-binding protein